MKTLFIVIGLFLMMLVSGGCSRNDSAASSDLYSSLSTIVETTTEFKDTSDTTAETVVLSQDIPLVSETQKTKDEVSFLLGDYQEHLKYFEEKDIDITVGKIVDSDSAAKQATIVWKEYMYCDEYDFENKDIKVYYDSETDCWLAMLSTNYDLFYEQVKKGEAYLDCDPCVIIRSDGKVLAYWVV